MFSEEAAFFISFWFLITSFHKKQYLRLNNNHVLEKSSGQYEHLLLTGIRNGDQSSFSTVFSAYYNDLVMFSMTFTRNSDISEEIVQEMFVKFWEDRELMGAISSLKSYFLKSIQNRSIDWLRHLKIRDKYAQEILEHAVLYENDTERYVLRSELELNIEAALSSLPPELAEVFRLSRFHGLTYPEIAKKLNISVRTVEVRISKALHLLRYELRDYFISLLLLCNFYN